MCRWPAGSAGVPGSVTSTTSAASLDSSSSASSSACARVDRGLRAPGAPGWRPCPTGPRSSGGELADVAQQVRQLGFAAEEAHADLLELGGRRWRRRPPPPPRRAARRSGRRCSWAADPSCELRRGRRSPPWRRSGSRRGRSGCGRRRRRRRRSCDGRPSRSAPTTSVHVTVDGSSRSGAPSRATSAISPARQLGERRCTRATGTENSAPIEARTALCAVRVGAARAERDARTRRTRARSG